MKSSVLIVCMCLLLITLGVAAWFWFKKRKTKVKVDETEEDDSGQVKVKPKFIQDLSLWDDFPQSKMIRTLGVIGPYFPLEHIRNDKIVAFDRVLTPAETQYLIVKGSPFLGSSLLEGGGENKENRSSSSAFIPKGATPWIKHLEQRFAAILQTKPENLEPIQFCRYTHGQKFEPHLDSLKKVGPPGQRMSTLLVYLNDLPPEEKGGRTIFDKFNAAIKPQQGTALAWNNVNPKTGRIDRDMWHEGEVLSYRGSEKFILNVWSRKRSFQ